MSLVVRLLLLVLLLSTRPAAAVPEALLAAGEASPLGLPFSGFPSVSIDEDGRVVALANSTGLFQRSGGSIVRLLAAGDVLPSGRQVAGVGTAAVGGSGCAVVRGFLVGGGSAVFRRCPAGLEVLVSSGTAAPGGGTIVDFTGPVATAGAHAAFGALLDDGRTVLLRATGSTLTRIVATGDAVPSGGVFTTVRLAGVTAAGRMGFRGAVSSGRDGFFAGDGGPLAAVVLVGEASPSGGSFSGLGGASLNESDAWAFRGSIDTGSDEVDGVFRVEAALSPPRVHTIVLVGDSTPSTGVTFRGFPSSLVPSINGSGVVAFRATLTGAESGSAIFTAAPGAPVARVVGTRDQTAVGALVRFRDPVIADDDSLCIPASISSAGPGLFVWRGGAFDRTPLAQVGDPTDVDTGQERFRFATPSVRARAEDAVFIGSREGIFRVDASHRIETMAFVGGPTPLGGTYAILDAPASGGNTVAFGAEIRDGRAGRALIRVAPHGTPHVVAAAGTRGPARGRFVDFFAGALDGLERPDVGTRNQLVFEATMQGSRVSRGLFRRSGAKVALVAGSGRRAPGTGTYQGFGTPVVVRGSKLAFVAQVDEGGGRIDTLVLGRGSRGTRIVSQGDTVSGRISGHVDGIDAPDASDTMLVWHATLVEQRREGVWARALRGGRTGLLVGTGDPAPEGGTFRTFERPNATASGAVFLARTLGGSQVPSLYLARATEPPAADAPPVPIERLLGPGTPSPLDGTVSEVVAVDANRAGTVAVTAAVVGGLTHEAIFLVPTLP